MDNSVKILIIIVIILVAVLGVFSGVILRGYLFDNNSIGNSSIQLTNNSNNPETTKSNNSGLISSQKAVNIFKQNMPSQLDAHYNVKLIKNGQNPYYKITSRYKKSSNTSLVTEAVGTVDAKTGKFLGGMD